MTVTAPHFVTTDGAGRWTGTGAPLSATQFDEDIYTLQAAINGLALAEGIGIGDISQPTPGTLLFTLTDATTRGPFPLPIGEWDFRGDWAATTSYIINDVVQHNGTLYAVIFAHTSASTFDAGANDGSGHNYYKVMVTFPSGVLPTGGTTNQALLKVNGTDFNCYWGTLPTGIPSGGATGQLVGYLSSGTGQWVSILQLPAGGSSGQVPVKNSSTDGDASWGLVDLTANVTGALPIANGGTGSATADLTPGDNITISGTWPNQTIASANAPLVVSALSATTGTISIDLSTCDVMTVTPTGDITLNASAPLAKTVSLIVTTSGTTSRTITFGTNFKASGTLATGTVASKMFIVKFDGNGAIFVEFARSAAL